MNNVIEFKNIKKAYEDFIFKIFSSMDSRCGVATVASEIPAVTDFPPDTDVFSIIETGDQVKLDGTTGDVIITKKDLG